ncbi:MAG TPA: D-glucuronyl C5-epimerase family protein [Gaiellaceae bacterium]|nr:D-glucuronyl C5-epimerase family protein [Gaiellaceae bacterium]
MSRRAASTAAVLALAATLLSGSASAKPPWVKDLSLIRSGLDRAVAKGRIDAVQGEEYRASVTRAAAVLPKLRSSRYRNLAAVVHQVAGFWKGYDSTRGRTLFDMLDFNTRWFASHWDQKAGTDVVDYSDGTWYRAFPGIGFQFHPLENFGKLNNFVSQKNDERAAQLAQSLMDRSVVRAGGLAWEYYFRFGGGRPPWISGMAQAVAAQALARAGTLLQDPVLTTAAVRVYRTVSALTKSVQSGPWIRLYAFNGLTVLNAQLQAIVSLQDYASQTNDQAAVELAARLQAAAIGLLPRFDTGAWSLYSLGGAEATLEYHKYVVRLLTMLSKRSQDPTLTSYAQRFSNDLREPPVVKEGPAPGAIYPSPADGYRDYARYVFWVSKRSTVRLQIEQAGKPIVVSRGWHSISWSPGRLEPGIYTPNLRAVDVVGNSSDTDLSPVEVRRDTSAPKVAASLAGRRLYWRGHDDASPWLRLRVVLRSSGSVRALSLGRESFRGSALLRAPAGTWSATLFAADSSGNSTQVALGSLRGRRG